MPTKLFLSISIVVLMGGSVPQTAGRLQAPARPPSGDPSSGVAAQAGASSAPATPESALFERARGSVFVVESESGHGSGFLVDARGLIATNDHVVRNTGYLAVAVDTRRKYPAVVVARDRRRDVAILRIHPRAIDGLAPLDLIATVPGIRAGERVIAIGSALTDDAPVLTVGYVSGVAAETIVADLNVNPGSSGGPVLNMKGDVIGITTFLVKAAAGPGLAGLVRADVVRPLLAAAAASLSEEAPPLQRLPVASAVFYPAEALGEPRDIAGHTKKLGPLRVDVLTPPVVYHEAHVAGTPGAPRKPEQQRPRRKPDANLDTNETGYLWHGHAARLEAIVGIRVMADPGKPGPGVTTGFRRMRLLRDGVEVIPIVPGRICGPPEQRGIQRETAGCIGLYQYPPEVFVPGARLELHVYHSDGAETKHRIWRLPPALVDLVWSDFEPWRTQRTASQRR